MAGNQNDDCMLLALPRELRDDIYEHYLKVEGGYTYNFESGKLSCATPTCARTAIDLELMLSCRQIAAEMRGLALKINTITFTTVAPDAKQSNLRYFEKTAPDWWDAVFKCLQEKDFNHPLRSSAKDWWPVPNFDESVCRAVSEAFPKFEPHLRLIQRLASEPSRHPPFFDYFSGTSRIPDGQVAWEDTGELQTWYGEVPSLQQQAALATLKLISSRSCWSEKAWSDVEEDFRLRPRRSHRVPTPERAADLIRYHSLYKPWTIVEDDASNEIMYDDLHLAYNRHDQKTEHEYSMRNSFQENRTRYFLSAASTAIHFLENIPGQRKNIRKIILDERYPGQRYSECHGLGFIEFCKENPQLRIERRANLWKNVWQTNTIFPILDGFTITSEVTYWIIEALALVPAGMPPGSFTLVLDGDPAPEQCTKLFQQVHRDAAWQKALLESFDRGILPEFAYHDKRRLDGYVFEDFPQALRDIARGTCRAVRANFDVGEPWDVEALIEARREWTTLEWEESWGESREYDDYQTEPPLPTWKELVEEVYCGSNGRPGSQ